ncbi:MAG: glutaredoxin [Candidatus Magasanikbacteria bacterium]|uniref:Glutaredoxin n=1 Tax=Candidatus Magasanikbacteria bacterium CG10_big_fil_rev_8_21_14_0_10_38_6 TaxID=1974647 RepID=A0A2M6P2E4_9BACT|nr:glutaredoxin [Candidatus Magasanikbacteria bacterium]NCS71744.1 glutaredoxin [Candidatus Magasanikbacteria bacterium]PIR77848.1 MAG: glutaredoxin [Candidatus Magasanikbacteria bacterium CG10_big_fil_rev_8_21_14_0_10_38_6]
MIELYQMEHCPFCAKVRQKMEELDLDYICRNMPKGSPKRKLLVALGGKEQVPYLVDTTNPKNPVMMYESDDINDYLEKTYS